MIIANEDHNKFYIDSKHVIANIYNKMGMGI